MNKRVITKQILDVISTSECEIKIDHAPFFTKNRKQLTDNLNRVTRAFSGSWHGYHANVYYEGIQPPPPGNSFSPEWGLMDPYGNGTHGWKEFSFEEVEKVVIEHIDDDFESQLMEASEQAKGVFQDTRNSLTTLIAVLIEGKKTEMLLEIQSEAREIEIPISKSELINHMSPKGTFMTRDTAALTQGTRVPPHIELETKFLSMRSPFVSHQSISRIARKLYKYMEMQDLTEVDNSGFGTKIFIGHGGSPVWRELKDFINDRLKLSWDEFNRESPAGLATKERLETLLENACFAFLVMTAEDEHKDGQLHARENVIHEIGLFQGRLGFRRAIVLYENGCAEFSNIHGLNQIRFLKGDIRAAFEEVRQVLEREGIISG